MTGTAQRITRQVSGAATWTYAAVFSDRAMRFAVFLVVARLVSPTAFGTVLLSLLAVEALQGLLNVGLPAALIQQANVSAPLLDTAFLINLAMCALTSAALFLGSGPIAALLEAPGAAALLRVLAITPLLSGLGAVHVALIQRDLGFKALAGRQAASSLLASLIAVLLANAGLGAWALVGRALVQAACGTALAWTAAAYWPRLRFDVSSVRMAAASGARLWAAGLANLVNARGLDFLAAVVLGAAALGALRIASQTVLLLIELSVGPLTALGFALLSRTREDRAAFEDTLATLTDVAALLIFPAFAGLYVLADPLLPLMFGERWAPAAAITPYMCALAPALYSQALVSAALFAFGRSDRLMQWALIEMTVTLLFCLAGAPFGLTGLAVAGTLRLYLMMPLGWHWLRRDVGIDPRILAAPAARCLAASVVMAAVVAMAKARLSHALAPLPLTATLIPLGVVVYGLLLPFTARRLWRRWSPTAVTRHGSKIGHRRQAAAFAAWWRPIELFVRILMTKGETRLCHGQAFLLATEGDTFERGLRDFRATPRGRDLAARRPNSLAVLRDQAALWACGPDTLGRSYAEFMRVYGLDEDYYARTPVATAPKADPTDEHRWFRDRVENGHDLRHLLTGYPPDRLGEICLLSFRAGQNGHRGAICLTLLGLLHPQVKRAAVVEAFFRGRRARLLDLEPWEENLTKSLAAVRASLGVVPTRRYPDPYAPEAYPVGKSSSELVR